MRVQGRCATGQVAVRCLRPRQRSGFPVQGAKQGRVRIGVAHKDLTTPKGDRAQGHLRGTLGGPAEGTLRRAIPATDLQVVLA